MKEGKNCIVAKGEEKSILNPINIEKKITQKKKNSLLPESFLNYTFACPPAFSIAAFAVIE